jgi:poly(A) polymerase
MFDPEQQRRFALDVVRKLRGAGFEALWAGGCVRDELLGLAPKDYDVATNATPAEIRRLFGRRRTLAVGAAFGTIVVLGPKPAGQVEVTTFRQDAEYSDGRHPDQVTFSNAREDAQRRDFTINGLFYDPVEERVIDYVGGQEDLRRRRVRAIGDARARFAEDKLRLLRAVRFAATYEFELEDGTHRAIREMATEITVVSAERIAAEMRLALTARQRVRAVRLLVETGLAQAVLPEIIPGGPDGERQLDRALDVLDRLDEPGFPLAMAALLLPFVDAEAARQIGRRWRLSNQEIDRIAWLLENRDALVDARAARWSRLQPILIDPGIEDLLALTEAARPECAADLDFCREKLRLPRKELDPAPLLTGNDLLARGLKPGPQFRVLLERVRAAQLDGEIHTKDEALSLIEQ